MHSYQNNHMAKMFATIILSIFFLEFSIDTASSATDKVICYYESWADESIFTPDDIDVDICTHVNFAFLRLNSDGSFRFDDGCGDENVLKQFGELKTKNPNVKLLISVGGWTEDSVVFSEVAADEDKKSNMAATLLEYMQTYNLDGIDIDWELPGLYGGSEADKENFVNLVTVLREALDENGGGLITITGFSIPYDTTYDVSSLSELVDAINIMTFDFHGLANDVTLGQNSPLYASSNETQSDQKFSNCNASISNWLEGGAVPEKLILGLGFYGHVFNLTDPNQYTVGSPANGADEDYTPYYEICQLGDGWNEGWDEEQKVPYKYSETQWIGYDNAASIALKVQYAKSQNLGGVMMWAVNDDDKDGACGDKNALLETIKNNL